MWGIPRGLSLRKKAIIFLPDDAGEEEAAAFLGHLRVPVSSAKGGTSPNAEILSQDIRPIRHTLQLSLAVSTTLATAAAISYSVTNADSELWHPALRHSVVRNQ